MQVPDAPVPWVFTLTPYIGPTYYERGIYFAAQAATPARSAKPSAMAGSAQGSTVGMIERVFRDAVIANAVLFFDAADSLFGDRTETKDEANRLTHLQTDYLLRKIEAFDGIVIVASNASAKIDPAFMRAITTTIRF